MSFSTLKRTPIAALLSAAIAASIVSAPNAHAVTSSQAVEGGADFSSQAAGELGTPMSSQIVDEGLARGTQAYQELVAALPVNPLTLPLPVRYPGAPEPEPLGNEQIVRWYSSDFPGGPFYFPVLEPFSHLGKDHPEVMAASLERTVEINNAAADDPVRLERALADDHDDLLVTMVDAWGPQFAEQFRMALAEGRLPKTAQLLAGYLGRAGGLASTTYPEKWFYGYDRPFVVAPDRIQRYHREGADDEYTTSPSFPSGHTNLATWKATLLAAMVPEIGLPMIARSSEVGFNRVVLGVHYPIDVIGGRMTGTAAAADRLNDPEFLGLVQAAGDEIRAEMEWRCGGPLVECVQPAAPVDDITAYTERMDYGLPHPGEPGAPMVVPQGAEGVLATRFPELTPEQRAQVLALTAADSGAPLDAAPGEASWQRLNIAAAWAAEPRVQPDGSVTLN